MVMRTEGVIIEGTSSGVNFTIPLYVTYDPTTTTTEQAVIEAMGSRVSTFEELAVQNGWTNAYWTFPNGVLQGAI